MSALWLVLFVSLVLWLAYQRASLAKATVVLGVLLAYYSAVRRGPALVEGRAVGALPAAPAAEHPPLRRSLISHRFLRDLQAHAAADVHDRARGARGRHGLVGRRAVHRRTRLEQAALGEGAEAHGRGAGLHRRALRRTVPDDRRLGHHAPARRPAARSLRLHQEEGLLGDDHPEEVRRARVLRLRALDAWS